MTHRPRWPAPRAHAPHALAAALVAVAQVAVALVIGSAAAAAQSTGPGTRADSPLDATDPAFNAGPMALTRLDGPIRIDGVPGEAAWHAVPPLSLTMYAPTFRGRPAQRTEIRVAYDDQFLYAAGWFYDTDPDGIRVNSLYRDRWNGDDAFAIYVDPFNDNQTAKWFGTTPAGMRFDVLVSDDGATLNGNWDTFWDAEATLTAEGWFAEVRIPFSSLGFQPGPDGAAVMGLTVTRLVSRTGERVTFPAIDPRFAFRQPSVARDVVLQDVRSPRPVYFTPYALAGTQATPVLESGASAWGTRRALTRELGFDLRYALSSQLTADVTVNTDFAQVEADDEQINLNRFSLFFPEKRRFFQEQSGVFDFSLGAGGRLFHSRQIGLTADREPVAVLGGARLVGRVGDWDVGLLDMQTDASPDAPGENFGVVRARRSMFNPYSYVGAIATSRLSEDGRHVTVGADGVLRGPDDLTLTLKAAASAADTDSTKIAARSHFHARLLRNVNDGLFYSLALSRSERDFRPGVGFLPRTDFTDISFYTNWFHQTEESRKFRRVWPGALFLSTWRNGDGSLESGQYAVWLQWETKEGGGGWIEPKVFIEDVFAPFSIGGEVDIPAGRHTYADLQVALTMSSGRRLRVNLDTRAGTFFDGTRQQAVLSPTWNVSRHLELGGRYQFTRLRFDDRDQATDIHLARLRVRTALNVRLSGNAFVQYNSTTDGLDFNVRLRYNVAEGTDLWLVYNEGLDTDRLDEPGGVRAPLSTGRSLIVKYSHTFGL